MQLGDYRVQQLIGEGKWGRVYLALQLSVNRRVGLKILNPARSEDDGARAQFLADARAKAAVQHFERLCEVLGDMYRNSVFSRHEIGRASCRERVSECV